ncbi:hypothetical protein NMQ01_10100 [Janibacter sp. CX7]|uniref:hypothetical protein n=1 Tax=Janibacter sp. CX7 TaxID=2963431 RepID=UPI0020CC0137|nr:hypothetical protein [Janibacter sp. CX7]UTT65076.1 hypothetical protein NMQ01_10100 [Janibacter sp. CX7]
MSVLAALLVTIGSVDLLRSLGPHPATARETRGLPALGLLLLLVVTATAGLLGTWGGVALTALAAAGLLAWTVAAERADAGSGHGLALSTFAAALLVQLAGSGWAPPVGGLLADWLAWSDLPWQPTPDHALLLAGLVLVQLATGNRLVRLVLVTTGALPARPVAGGVDGELRGGRLLGPLERLFILGLGLAGELTAAGLVIAAKGLIRWPELRSHASSDDSRRPSDIDKVTEYFLVGSFVSWLVALGALLLAS